MFDLRLLICDFDCASNAAGSDYQQS